MYSLIVHNNSEKGVLDPLYNTLVFFCPHCDKKLIYGNFVPVKCPYCDKGLPNYKKLLEDLYCRVSWHNTGTII